eukprot:1436725-Rhodomonas_salina.1
MRQPAGQPLVTRRTATRGQQECARRVAVGLGCGGDEEGRGAQERLSTVEQLLAESRDPEEQLEEEEVRRTRALRAWARRGSAEEVVVMCVCVWSDVVETCFAR